MNINNITFAIGIALASACNQAVADEYSAESDFFGESPMVLTVSRMHKPLANSPASVSVIDRQMIRDSGAREVADIFRMVPGFIVGHIFGHTPTVTYHGLGEQWQHQLQVLIDGRSVFIPSFGGVPWANLPLLLEDIERIEVTRGPNAVTYGANAFLATINIITRHAAEDLGSKAIVTRNLDSDNTVQDVYFRYGNNYEDLDWRITAGREKDDGYEQDHDSKILEKFNIRTDFLTAYNQFWTIQAGLNNSTIERGYGEVTDPEREEDSSNDYLNFKWELVNDKISTTLLYAHARQNVSDHYLTDPLNAYLIDEFPDLAPYINLVTEDIFTTVDFDRRSERSDLEIFQNVTLTDSLSWNYGGSVRKDKVKSFYLFNDNDDHKVDTERLFTSLEWKAMQDLTLDLGIMAENTTVTEQEESYRLSLIRKLGQHSLRVVGSTARRNPVLYEVNGETQFSVRVPAPFNQIYSNVVYRGNGDLDPESIESYEIGLFSEVLDSSLTTDLKLFSYKITDQITEGREPIDPVQEPTVLNETSTTSANGGVTKVKGVEASFNYSPQRKSYRLYGGISLIRSDSFDIDIEHSMPEYTAFTGGHYDLSSKQQISGVLYWVDEMSWLDSDDNLDSYHKLDLRYQYTIIPKMQMKVELIGYNLLQDIEDYLLSKTQGRTYLIRLSSRF